MAEYQRIGRRVAVVAGYRTPFCKAGNVVPTIAAPNVARELVILANLPPSIPATTVMRACASGTEATTTAANAIALGQIDCAIVGGVECLIDVPILFSRPFAQALVSASRAKNGWAKLKALKGLRLKDFMPIPPSISEYSTGLRMGQHAEAMAKENGISRLDQDELAWRSHQRAAAATADGRLPAEIVPVYLSHEKRAVTQDNHIRADTTQAALGQTNCGAALKIWDSLRNAPLAPWARPSS
jgi:acetyl-CoA acyltransferase